MAAEKTIFLAISCVMVVCVESHVQSPFTNDSLMLIVNDLYLRVIEYQVPKTKHFFPPFQWEEKQGMWPSDVRMNFHGKLDFVLFRDFMAIFDNNMFATTYILSCLFEAKRYIHETWYGPDHLELTKGLAAIKSHHDMNVNFSNSLMTFWPQKYNETLDVYNSYPVNLNDVVKMTEEMPLNVIYKFLEKLGLKNIEEIIKLVMSIRQTYTVAFHIPPDFDDTFLNIGLGSIISELSSLFPTYHKLWMYNNNNLTSVFDALKKYAYRPFSGDQRVNTIDPRTYYYLRRWLQQERDAGNDVALVPTWVQDTDEVRTWFDKGVMMPYNVNNIDVTVCANFIFGVTSGIINGLFAPSLLDDPQIMQIYNDTSRMIAFQVQTNFSDRPDLALTYYPSVIEFYWFVARTYNQLEESIQRTGSLPHKGMVQVFIDFKHVLRAYASPAILSLGTVDKVYGWDVVYFDDFLGNVDNDYDNKSVNNAEDRIFTTSMALNALLTIWSTQQSGKLIWDKDATDNVKKTAHDIVVWLNYKVLSDEFEPWNAFFSGSYKGFTNNAEDRIFTTSMALNALLTIWSTQQSGKLIWDKDATDNVKKTAHDIVVWLNYKVLSDEFEPWNAFFSGSYKGFTTNPRYYPENRVELFNGTWVNRAEVHTARSIQGIEGLIPEEEYEEMMKNVSSHYHTPTVFPGYNQDGEFFPFWCSEAYTYVIAMLGLAKYIATM